MRRSFTTLASLLCALTLSACATPPPPNAAAPALDFALATVEEGAAVLAANDEYMHALTPADLSIRLKRQDTSASVADLAQLYRAGVRTWTQPERVRLQAMIDRAMPRLAPLADWLPDRILLVKVSHDVESGLPHTRGAAIMMGEGLPVSDDELDEVFLHETFHVLSRANPARRDALYGVIGFVSCTSIDLPAATRARIFTNPDAPLLQHAAPISAADPNLLATPILFADPALYDPARVNIYDYFDPEIAPLRRDADGRCAPAEGVAPSQTEMAEAIFAHAGRNTNYMFHPEELMADNFAQMMTRRADAPNPEVYDRLAAVLGIARP